MDTTEFKPCPSCFARGTIDCKGCNGSGKVINPSKSYAYHSKEPTLLICNICAGTGKIMCIQCMGNGKIIINVNK